MLAPPDTRALAVKLRQKYVETCDKCRRTGTVIQDDSDDEPWNQKSQPCACAELVRFKVGLREARIPREFFGVLSIKPEYNLDRFKKVQEYAAELASRYDDGDGFLFYGLNGAGKTMCGCYILAHAIKQGYTASYLTAKELAAATGRAKGDDAFSAWLGKYLANDFLVLDELGKEYRNGNEYSLSELDELLRSRRGERRPTIICTNMSLHEFRDGYGHSFYSLTKDALAQLAFEATTDFRDELKRRKATKNAKV